MSTHTVYSTVLAVLLVLAALEGPSAWGWGKEGHETIGIIADTLLASTPAAQRVQGLLMPGETLATAALWARLCQRLSLLSPSSHV
jgi:hypothetical protein